MKTYTNATYYVAPTISGGTPGPNIGITVTINGVASYVPIDTKNVDYRNIMALVAAGQLVINPAS
jgi:hypothetical protein